jgi:hypothetical protein
MIDLRKKIFKYLVNLAISLSFLGILFSPIQTHAQSINDINILGVKCFFPDQQGCEEGQNIYDIAIDFGLNLAPFLAVLVIMWGGYKYLFSGLPGEQEGGKKSIQNGAIGLVVVLVARPLATVVKGIFGDTETEGELELETTSVLNFIKTLVSQFLIPLSSVVTVAFFIVGAYYIITARGDDERISAGRNAIRNAVIGLVIVLLSTTVVNLIVLFLPIK